MSSKKRFHYNGRRNLLLRKYNIRTYLLFRYIYVLLPVNKGRWIIKLYLFTYVYNNISIILVFQYPLSHNTTDPPHLSTRRTLPPSTSVSPPLYAAVSDLRVLVSISAFCGLLFVLFIILCCWKRKQIVKCSGKQSKQTSSSCAVCEL